ncbi:MAG TPA: fibronectin type III domain-containing protein [Gaiellaceae bacterium]|nr:fibronectin type III domain-containing protein [Gaiellaceae bacterium]
MVRRAQVVLGLAVLVAFALASSPSQGAGSAKPADFDKAVAAMEKHADKWLDKRNVVGVGIGENEAGKAVIHVYKVKDEDEGIPSDVDGVAVAQLATGRIDPRAAPTDRWPRPVPIGVSSGLADFATGTLGARVTDGTHVYALSNNHVFAGVNTASIGDPITQPGPDDGGSSSSDTIATLSDYQEIDFSGGDNTMDAAIALTSIGDVGTATPPDGYGAPSTTPAVATIGMGVQKYGRTTGLQQGTVQDVNLAVDVCYVGFEDFCFPGFEARFVNQIAVSPSTFSAPGDSGSLMVTQGGNQPVALLFAGDGQLTIGNPIIPVLQRFNVTIEGGPPTQGPPAAPQSLTAAAGDNQVSLTWNAPAFDGGSAVTSYNIFRGTSPGAETFLTGSTTTDYVDASAVNGTTYYYKVSASNANGEGAKSNEASATPIAAVAPTALPAPLDDFNRPDETLGGNWTNAIIGGEGGFVVSSNQLACSVATTCTAWRNTGQYGPDVEVWARLPVQPGVGNQLRLYARLQMPGTTGYVLRTNQLSGTDEVWLERFNGGLTRLLTIPQELANGDTMLLRAKGSSIEAWRMPSGGTWTRLGVVQDSTYPAAASVGVGLRGTTGRVDDFGARSTGATSPPGAPTGLGAVAGDGQVALSWTAPAFDGGTQLTGYTVYRDTSPDPNQELTTLPPTPTSYVDQTAANGTTYYYKVSASNVNGLGAKSNEASATPIAAVAPMSLSTPLDNFNRPNETLSDGGNWTNAIIGGESGFVVSSNQLACSVTTTCTARRNNLQFGPNVEVWARLTTLPGVSNQLRLYARLLGTTGYVLRTNQLSGVDEVWLERFNGGLTRLLTIPQELAGGDTMLLRANGATIEAWRLPSGGSWSRLGVVQDSTYAAAGYVGVGLRGTTGRVDDFGARTLGGQPPDTTAPSDPTSLQASAVSASQIDLSWSASSDASGINLYRIERCSGPSCGNFSEVATVPGNQTTFQNTGLSASTSYTYRVRAEDNAPAHNLSGFSNLSSATTLGPPKPLFFSLQNDGTVGGVAVANEDVVSYDGTTFTLAFDGSDVGLASRRLDAFGWLDADSLVFSLDADGATLPGIAGTIDDSDVVRFDATSLGSTTSGTFSVYFDGSDVALTTSGEDVDAFELLANGTIVLSTGGSASVPGVSAGSEDLLVFTPSSLGATTSGTYAMYFDGSDVGISTSNENVDAAAVDAAGRVYLSTTGNFTAAGVSGADEDVFVFNPTALGAATSGTFTSAPYFDGSVFGLGGNDVAAIDLPLGA